MNCLELVKSIDSATKSSGTGYYETYLMDTVVVKVYESKERHAQDVDKHLDLDRKKLLPKMIAEFYNDGYWYLVVERIEALDKDIRAKCNNIQTEEEYWPVMYAMKPEYRVQIDAYVEKLGKRRYLVGDRHVGNFGYLDGKLVCLDEGCLSKR